MILRACRAAPALLALAGIVWLGGCKVDKEEFHGRLYSCNPNAANPACGTDINEKPMACVPAYQLGGRNFCATGCDAVNEPAEGEGAICLSSGPKAAGAVSGARLPRCNPTTPGSCNHEELTCLRTDLIVDEGVCMTVNACERDTDCRDPVRAKCMGELVRETYGTKSELKAQNTYCLQSDCKVSGTACSPGEVCLRNVAGIASLAVGGLGVASTAAAGAAGGGGGGSGAGGGGGASAGATAAGASGVCAHAVPVPSSVVAAIKKVVQTRRVVVNGPFIRRSRSVCVNVGATISNACKFDVSWSTGFG
jgi:hypothetical protein